MARGHDRIEALLTELAEPIPEPPLDTEELSKLIDHRQRIIDRLGESDESLALVREAIASSADLAALFSRVISTDRLLLELVTRQQDELRTALSKTGKGLRAARGYRLHIPHSPAIIDKRA